MLCCGGIHCFQPTEIRQNVKSGRDVAQNFAHALGNRFDFPGRDALRGADYEQPLRSIELNCVHASSSHEAGAVASASARFLQRILEESVFERCLKRARPRLADSKPGTDLE